ncbi:phage antirepressor KilAC domain-containing protein [Bacteroidetes bacterium endosymbiont of Geopemphigus sp.]|uniref:phage antirepressor KilAC domain-containing protein n=1 Tax=Bacteroidetes bacterium endosymbiont of Geopemphigus sp. TaxID=2047937 RepID=UPI000CD29A92|nr:phage antirepressor KilAC domain-containing protein [Bacteroidetes bacterium endosymbiont of Geopemphigus sp.]
MKVEYYDKILKIKEIYTFNQIAKELDMSVQGLNKLLHENNIQYRRDSWLLYQKYQNRGYTKTHAYIDERGQPKTSLHKVWIKKGREFFIHEMIKEER